MEFLQGVEPAVLAVLCVAAFCAGALDAVVGGGGLVQIPALFLALPNAAVPSLLGTSKLAGVWGTGVAAWRYSKAVHNAWPVVLPAAGAAFGGSFLGAITVTLLPGDFVRRLLPLILALVALYTFRRKDFGRHHQPVAVDGRALAVAGVIGAGIGFYDGFFGPGTGSFLMFAFVRVFGFDFLHASAGAKVVNVACNVAALIWFGLGGHYLLAVALVMAVCNVFGSTVGSALAIRRGSDFVRKIFLVVVLLLIVRTAYDAWWRG